MCGDFVDRETGEKAQLHDLLLTGVEPAELLEAVFDVVEVPPGSYDVVCHTIDGAEHEARLDRGFRVEETRGDADLRATVLSHRLYHQKRGEDAQLLVVLYRNLGRAETVSPLFKVEAVRGLPAARTEKRRGAAKGV